jgi:ABC-type transport system substrate-binding protein
VRYAQTRFLFGIAAAVALVAPTMGTAAARQPERHANAGSVPIYPAATADLWPKSLDPALTQDTTSMQVIGLVYSGLLKLNADDQVVPDLAAGMPTLSADKRTYTFKIRPDARFSDGTPVTAQDVVASWTRALSRQEQSTVAPAYMGGIVGAAALNAGKSHTLAGARAVDSRITNFSNGQFERLVAQADVAPAGSARTKLYVQAQEIALQQVATIPIGQTNVACRWKANIHGLQLSPGFNYPIPVGNDWTSVSIS